MLGLIGFRGCEGPQPSKVRKDHWSFDQDLGGVRSLGAVLVDTSFVCAETRHAPNVGAFIGSAAARDRSPPRSGRIIGALIKTWRASGPSAPCWSMQALFCRDKACAQCWTLLVSAAARDRSPPRAADNGQYMRASAPDS